VTGDGAVNILVPLDALPGLSVPPAAITDGSADPVWVELPVRRDYLYGRKRMFRLPLDAATAETARRWLRFDRRRRFVVTPVFITMMSTAFVLLLFFDDTGFDGARLALYAAAALLQLGTVYVERKLTVVQHPALISRSGLYLHGVPAEVAGEWVRRNPAVRVVPWRPRRGRRYPSLVYRWSAGLCAAAAAAVWWFALSDGESDLIALFAFVALVGAAVVSAFKALPVGFIRFDDARDPH
jgi:hypothetical protein